MRIAIVDDEAGMREQLSGYILRFADERRLRLETASFSCGDALLTEFEPVYDVIIFDVDMPGTNGLDTARQVRAMDADVVILFVTNIAQYAINGYEVEAVDYIIKPIGYYDFALKFERALRRVRNGREEQIMLDTSEGIARVRISDVLYVEVQAHYLIYHTAEKDYQVRGSLREHEAALRGYHFSRAHKSYLVNLMRIENIKGAEVLVDGAPVPLGRAYKDSLMADYLRYLR
jgi:DNA-binding LytR/AlgR family response regulator